jgi:hydrogenase expression/formation protein HypC
MCLAVPGQIKSIESTDPVLRSGKVDFGGVSRDVNLSFVPEANVGDYVIVHVGFALSTLDEQEANEVFGYLKQMEEAEAESSRIGAGS